MQTRLLKLDSIRIPKLRFPEFSEEWQKKKLREVFQRVTQKNKENNLNVLTISAQQGLVSQEEYFTKSVSAKNVSGYYLLHNGDFAYNKSYSKGYPIGAIKRLTRYEKGVVSTLYICFKIKSDESGEFLEKYFDSGKQNFAISQIVQEGARNHGLLNISVDDFFDNIEINIPTISEQRKIAIFLDLLNGWIENLNNQKQFINAYKKGVIQKIFSQEVRFKDHEGKYFPDWKERKLSEVLFEHKSKSTGAEEVFSVSVKKGLINQIEHLGRSYSAAKTDHYNLVKPHDIVYTKSPTGDFPFGIIKQSLVSKSVIVSPLYGVFSPESPGLGYMLNVYFESARNTLNYLSSIIRKGAKNTINITNNTFLSKSLKLPVSIEEQNQIGELFKELDIQVNNIKSKISKAEQWKKGLMQKMFI